MSTATHRVAVDHFGDAIRGALSIRPTHTAQALASDPRGAWVSSEYPQPFRAPHAATQTPGRIPRPADPTHHHGPTHHHDGHPVVTNSPAVLAGRK